MRLRRGAVDLSGRLARRPSWGEFVTEAERVGTPPHVFVCSEQAIGLAFSAHATVCAPGHIVTSLRTRQGIGVEIWTEDSDEMAEDGS